MKYIVLGLFDNGNPYQTCYMNMVVNYIRPNGQLSWCTVGDGTVPTDRVYRFHSIHEARKALNKAIVDDIRAQRTKYWRNIIAEVPDFGSVKIHEVVVLK